MTYGYHMLLALHVVSAAMLVALLALVAMNRREPLAPWLAGVFAALLLWTVAYIFELASDTLAGKLAWADLQFVGATVMPLLWLLAMRRAAGARLLPAWLTTALWLGCLAIIACVYLNPDHLFRGHPALDHSGPVAFLAADYGPLYHLLWMPFAYGLLVISLLTLARAALRGPQLVRARPALRLQPGRAPGAARALAGGARAPSGGGARRAPRAGRGAA